MPQHWTTYKTETDLRAALVANARSYQGTKYRHQGRTREHGLDCLGLAIANFRDFDFSFELQEDDHTYSMNPDGYYLVERLQRELRELNSWREALPGDLLLQRWHISRPPQHVGLVVNLETDNCLCVHASRTNKRVVENRWDREDLITHAFTLREFAAMEVQS